MLQDLLDLLDRAWASLDAEESVDFAVHLFRFYRLLTNDSRIAGILEDIRVDETESQNTLFVEHARIAERLTAITDHLEHHAAEHFEPETSEEDGYDRSLPQIREWLRRAIEPVSPAFSIGRLRVDGNELEDAAAALVAVAESSNQDA